MAVSSILQKKKYTPTVQQQANRNTLKAGTSKSNLDSIRKATTVATTLKKGSNPLKPKTNPVSNPFQMYASDTFKRLGVTDETDFNRVTGLNFTDTYQSEFNKNYQRGGDMQFLDQLIGEQFRTQRDAGSAINSLNAQMDAQKSNLEGEDSFLGYQTAIERAVRDGATDANTISQQTGLSPDLVNAIQNGDVDTWNATIGDLTNKIKSFGQTDSSITRNAQIAQKLGISEDLVNRITKGQTTGVGVSAGIKSQLSRDVETSLQRAEEDYEFKKSEAQQRLKEYQEDFLIKLDEQKNRNEIIEGNMSRLAGITGAGFSSRGLGGMEEVSRQSIAITDEMMRLYDRATTSVGKYLQQLETDWVRKNEDAQASINDSINNVTRSYFANIEAIKSKFGEVSDEAITQLNDASAKYLENITNAEQQGFENMITINQEMRANIQSAMEMQEFDNQEASRIATQLVNSGASMNDVAAMVESGELTPLQAREVQSQMVANTIATLSAIPGAEAIAPQYSQDIVNGINEGKTPFEILDEITSDGAFQKAVKEAGMSPIDDAQLKNLLLQNKELENELRGTLPGSLPDSDEIVSNSQEKRGKALLQCGELVNDYWQQVTGSRAGVGDTYESKVAAITKVGESDLPQEGGLFAYSTGMGNPGHVGIVQSVNADGSIEVLEANKEGALEGGMPVEATYSADMVQKMIFSQAPVSVNADIETLIETDPNYQLANNILEGFGSYPSKTSKNYEKVVNAVAEVSEYKANSTDDPQLKVIYESAKYDNPVSETTSIKLTDAFTVLSSVSNLTTQLENMEDDIGPIEGLLRKKNPYDVDSQAIAAQLNALVPKVARGVFGEVGVLTDQDVERYMKTLPNTKMTGELATVVGDLLKITVTKSLINTITTQAKAQRNVINFASDYGFAKEYLASKGISPNPRASYIDEGDKIKVGNHEVDLDELEAKVNSGVSNEEVESER